MKATINDYKQLILGELGAATLDGKPGAAYELHLDDYPTALAIVFDESYGVANITQLYDFDGDVVELTYQELAELERLIERTWEFELPEQDDEPDGMDLRKMRLEDGY